MRHKFLNIKLDKIDHAVIKYLQNDGRISNSDLSEKVGLSQSACLRRVKALEKQGIIEGYVAVMDQAAAGLTDNVFVQITVEKQTKELLFEFEKIVRQCPQIIECYLMSGDADYLLRVIVSDASDYEKLHMDVLTTLPGVSNIKSNFSLRTVTKKNEIPFNL
ncbi:MAG: Lrp/AsnC family transcriptional regulator [Kordiimonadaceae bacterium]|jgi:Lrp/AsnC family leucine-responsive transcriptional regulator|nr:Lrp/AsnC family transcriptional regulator [Kordiimonadaceae bacterium]MDC0111873.1 Lrp/AsnC family transcriptional regulator [Emcibacteraceae bacterium]MBT6135563.1 Lrp/AsnC family transcriptional regulator [Kordiimonadaceae bacterium]MBT6466412.1 Lrp/AsnC family transcriptional regulator [Kordiimonadaceae bacterium]MBT7544276.1 Lrp/AsnC family transcriptional regulator [Kordiimonadaceae bacterium]|tara:strand:- start:1573 stop:2058 length:486 start_codon:yes stop_codon:yes gene_type:complete